MFKKRNIEKKTDLTRQLQEIQIIQSTQKIGQIVNSTNQIPKSRLSKKINKFHSKQPQDKQQALKGYQKNIYGQIQTHQFEGQKEQQIQKHQQQNRVSTIDKKPKTHELGSKYRSADSQILKMQNQYLQSALRKEAHCDPKELKQILEAKSSGIVKCQSQSRQNYLRNLLQNQHQRMEYASKKELKVMRQERERQEKQLMNKYKPEGRRSYINQLRNSALIG